MIQELQATPLVLQYPDREGLYNGFVEPTSQRVISVGHATRIGEPRKIVETVDRTPHYYHFPEYEIFWASYAEDGNGEPDPKILDLSVSASEKELRQWRDNFPSFITSGLFSLITMPTVGESVWIRGYHPAYGGNFEIEGRLEKERNHGIMVARLLGSHMGLHQGTSGAMVTNEYGEAVGYVQGPAYHNPLEFARIQMFAKVHTYARD